MTVLAIVNVDARGPVAQGIGAPARGRVGFWDRVPRVLG